jgi:peptide/nickel transport system substrate-binding protein
MRFTRISLLSLAVVVALAACAAPSRSQTPQAGGTFVVALDSRPLTLDPAHVTDLSSARVTTQVCETLVEFDPQTGGVSPLLAQSWAVSSDGRVWTFTLRSGVTFHDGTPLTSAAVVENFNRWMDTSSPYHQGDFDYWQILFGGFKGSGSIVRSVERADDLRFRITLEEPYSPLLAVLSMFPFAIVSPTAMQKDVDELRLHPVGTGAFRFVAQQSDGGVTLEANEQYWGGKPQLDGIQFNVMPDAAARLNALRDGKVQLVEGSDAASVSLAKKMSGVRVLLRPGEADVYLSVNNTTEPFTDPQMRQALAYAINRRAIIDAGYGGLAQTAGAFVPPGIGAPNTEPADMYNVATAKRLMRDAGYGGGTMTQLWYPAKPRPLLPDPQAVAESIAKDLEAVGFLVAVNSADSVTYQAHTLDGSYALSLQGWTGDSPDVDSFLTALFASDTASRSTGYNDPQLKTTLDQARAESDEATRRALYDQAQKSIADDMPRIPLVHPQVPILVSGKVQGYVPSPIGAEPYRTVSLTR